MELVDRYGSAIEADLHAVYGLDLLDFFRGKHPWPKLARLLGHLRDGTLYWTAAARDRDLAKAIAERQGDEHGKPSPLPLSEMSTTNQLLVSLVDGVTVAVRLLERLGGMKPEPPRRVPVERPAIADMLVHVAQQRLDDLVAEAEDAQRRVREATNQQ